MKGEMSTTNHNFKPINGEPVNLKVNDIGFRLILIPAFGIIIPLISGLIDHRTDYLSIRAEDIAFFYATHKLVCLVDNRGQKFLLDQSLSDIEKQLDESQFFRVNRKYLVNMSAIRKMKSFPKSKLLIELEPEQDEEIIVSQENVAGFKAWMGG